MNPFLSKTTQKQEINKLFKSISLLDMINLFILHFTASVG